MMRRQVNVTRCIANHEQIVARIDSRMDGSEVRIIAALTRSSSQHVDIEARDEQSDNPYSLWECP